MSSSKYLLLLCLLVASFALEFVEASGENKQEDNKKASDSKNKEDENKEDDLCASVNCDHGAECLVREGKATCDCTKACPRNYAPVCGSDDKTYNNECLFQEENCKQKGKLKINCDGTCKRDSETKRVICPQQGDEEIQEPKIIDN